MNVNQEGGFKAIFPKRPEDNFLNFPKNHSKLFFSQNSDRYLTRYIGNGKLSALVSHNIMIFKDHNLLVTNDRTIETIDLYCIQID